MADTPLIIIPREKDPNKIEVTPDIIIGYILSRNEQEIQHIWHQIDVHKKDRISMEQFRKLLVLVVDQYIDSQMNAKTRDSHIVTTSLTLMKVAHSMSQSAQSGSGTGGDEHAMQKPSVIFDCNEMMELEAMMGDFVKHARSAVVVDYLYDQFLRHLAVKGVEDQQNVTKSFYLLNFQKYFDRNVLPTLQPIKSNCSMN